MNKSQIVEEAKKRRAEIVEELAVLDRMIEAANGEKPPLTVFLPYPVPTPMSPELPIVPLDWLRVGLHDGCAPRIFGGATFLVDPTKVAINLPSGAYRNNGCAGAIPFHDVKTFIVGGGAAFGSYH